MPAMRQLHVYNRSLCPFKRIRHLNEKQWFIPCVKYTLVNALDIIHER